MKNHAVVIVGGGPTGLMLAGELALANVDVAIVERRLNQEFNGWRAGGLHSRSFRLEIRYRGRGYTSSIRNALAYTQRNEEGNDLR